MYDFSKKRNKKLMIIVVLILIAAMVLTTLLAAFMYTILKNDVGVKYIRGYAPCKK